MKSILILLTICTLSMAESSHLQWMNYKKECQKTGGKAYKTQMNTFKCRSNKQSKYVKKKAKKTKISGPEFKDGISAFITASF